MGFNRYQSPPYSLGAQLIQGQPKGRFPVTLVSVGRSDIVAEVTAFVEECSIDSWKNPNQTDHEANIVGYPIIRLGDEIVRKRRGRGNADAIIQPVVQLPRIAAYRCAAEPVFTIPQGRE